MYGTGIVKGMWVTLKHLLGKKITVQYPEERPVLQKRFRGCLQFDFAKCIVCGVCASSCPNDVLKLETHVEEGSKKKKLDSYTIDLQYCMFCNICVEGCPTQCLSFSHDFELAKYRREDLRIVYHRPAHMDAVAAEDAGPSAEEQDQQQKKIAAMVTALAKNPFKALGKLLDTEEQQQVMADLILQDPKKAEKIGEFMVTDREKAKKIAVAFIAKAAKEQAQGEAEV